MCWYVLRLEAMNAVQATSIEAIVGPQADALRESQDDTLGRS